MRARTRDGQTGTTDFSELHKKRVEELLGGIGATPGPSAGASADEGPADRVARSLTGGQGIKGVGTTWVVTETELLDWEGLTATRPLAAFPTREEAVAWLEAIDIPVWRDHQGSPSFCLRIPRKAWAQETQEPVPEGVLAQWRVATAHPVAYHAPGDDHWVEPEVTGDGIAIRDRDLRNEWRIFEVPLMVAATS